MIDFETQFRTTLTHLESSGTEYAEARATSWYLQEMKKVMLSNLMNESNAQTISGKEQEALRNTKYVTYLDGVKVAIEKELKAKARYEKVYATYESLRSLCSQNTALAKL